jgi:hypothetical protein
MKKTAEKHVRTELIALWIEGNPVAAQGTRTGIVTNPATGEVIRTVPNAADIDTAVRAAHAALPEWREIPPLVVKRLRIYNFQWPKTKTFPCLPSRLSSLSKVLRETKASHALPMNRLTVTTSSLGWPRTMSGLPNAGLIEAILKEDRFVRYRPATLRMNT